MLFSARNGQRSMDHVWLKGAVKAVAIALREEEQRSLVESSYPVLELT
jgi:hypothetical protein